jgi:nucleoside-diphosphate-sugar epimerase
VAADVKKSRDSPGIFEQLDVTKKQDLSKVILDHKIDTIYHLAGILSARGEQDPLTTWDVNVNGLLNVLESGKSCSVERIFWPSSIAVFGPEAAKNNTPQDSPLSPITIYGASKVAGEALCKYYFSKYRLDVRSMRYPGIISGKADPGGGTTDYAVEMYKQAVKNGKYTCFVKRQTKLPMMYMPDAISGAIQIMEADPSEIERISYNVASMSFTAEELANSIKKHIQKFECSFKPDSSRQKIADSWPSSIDDHLAREDWGFSPVFDLETMTENLLQSLSKI